MAYTRRSFMKSAVTWNMLWVTSGLGAFNSLLSGCSLGNVFSQIGTYVGLGVAAVSGVVAILSGAGIVSVGAGTAITAILALIKAGFADISAAVSEYENAAAADKTTLAGKISTAIQAVVDQLQTFWNDLKIPDTKLAGTIQALLELVISTLMGFLTKLPPAPTPAKAIPGGKRLTPAPKLRTSKGFVTDYNNILAQNGYSNFAIK